jgi:hypothetical protein
LAPTFYDTPSHVLLATNEHFSLDFEKHNRAIGSKLLHQMHYTGGGVGKHGKGIFTAIMPEIRQRKMPLIIVNFIAFFYITKSDFFFHIDILKHAVFQHVCPNKSDH